MLFIFCVNNNVANTVFNQTVDINTLSPSFKDKVLPALNSPTKCIELEITPQEYNEIVAQDIPYPCTIEAEVIVFLD